MDRHIGEAARSATAMEGVAKSLEITAKVSAETLQGVRSQLRASLAVIISGGAIQDRISNVRFDAKPNVVNSGPTPARNVRIRIKAAILPVPLPEDFDQSIETDEEGGNLIAAHQTATISAAVEDYVPEDQTHGLICLVESSK